jgi:isopenicillin-N N-acyltransferase-like protein
MTDRPARLPRIVTRGTPRERGTQYGAAAADRIRKSVAFYREVFRHRAGLDWDTAVALAKLYEPSIARFAPGCLEEMRGIAEGAGVAPDEILALNARSELMFTGARAKDTGEIAAECTSFAVLPEASENSHTIVGQNWDWLPFAAETVVYIEAHRSDGPNYVTIVEAGLLAKMGFNDAGLGVCTNTLVSSRDVGQPGVPYHVLLRALLDAPTMTDATRCLMTAERALSANYLLAHSDGLAVNVETLPGGREGVSVSMPEDGVLAHSNHFVASDFAPLDARVAQHPHSLFRLDAMRRGLRRGAGQISMSLLTETLRSHQNKPEGICGHPNERVPAMEQRATVISLVADLASGELWLTPGPPCSHDYERHHFATDLTVDRRDVTAH